MYPKCVEASLPLSDGWRLFYFETKRWHQSRQTRISVSQPFRKAHTSPMPMYLSTIRVCRDATAKRCLGNATRIRLPNDPDTDECPDDDARREIDKTADSGAPGMAGDLQNTFRSQWWVIVLNLIALHLRR